MGKHVHVVSDYDLEARTLRCNNCGVVPLVMKNGIPKCSVARRSQRGNRGSRRVRLHGYIEIYKDDIYVGLEHRLIMEDFLNRKLLPGENVHHKNGVKDDNRLDNLELWVSHQPSGQRPEDLVAWAHEILDRYERAPWS